MFALFIDIVAARAAGMRCSLIASGLTDTEPLRQPASLLVANLTLDAALRATGALPELLEHVSRTLSRELKRRVLGADKDPAPARHNVAGETIEWRVTGAACATTRDTMAAPASTMLFTIDDTLRRLTHEGVGEQTLCTAAIQAGMAIMWEDGARWVQTGLTSIEEIIRVTRDIQ